VTPSGTGLLLGLDLTEIDRIRGVLDRHGERFLARVFRPGEIRRERRHPRAFAEHVAGRFAAKEAAMKALGVGLGAFGFHDVAVVKEVSGAPRLVVTGAAADLAGLREIGARLAAPDDAGAPAERLRSAR